MAQVPHPPVPVLVDAVVAQPQVPEAVLVAEVQPPLAAIAGNVPVENPPPLAAGEPNIAPLAGPQAPQQNVDQVLAELTRKVESLSQAKVQGDVEQALRNVRKSITRAQDSFDAQLSLSSLEILVDTAKFGAHKDAVYYEACLGTLREHLYDGNVRILLQKLLGSTEDCKVASVTDKWKKTGSQKPESTVRPIASPGMQFPQQAFRVQNSEGCFACGSPMHFARFCPSRRRQAPGRRPYRGFGRGSGSRGGQGFRPY